MKLSIPLLGAYLLAASTALYAQAPQTDAGKGERFDCSKAKDPKRCEERREKMKAAHSSEATANSRFIRLESAISFAGDAVALP